jgi:hypothetical protein
MEPTGTYLLLFSSLKSAQVYRDEAIRQWKVANQYMPRSMVPSIPTPPGYLEEGEDVHVLLQSFALIPITQKLNFGLIWKPFPPSLKTLMEAEGYLEGYQTPSRRGCQVMLHADGIPLTHRMVMTGIRQDGEDRGFQWSLLTPDPIGRLRQCDQNGLEPVASPPPSKGADIPRWIVQFQDAKEARKFARAWHHKRLPVTDWSYGKEHGEEPPLIKTELLW